MNFKVKQEFSPNEKSFKKKCLNMLKPSNWIIDHLNIELSIFWVRAGRPFYMFDTICPKSNALDSKKSFWERAGAIFF